MPAIAKLARADAAELEAHLHRLHPDDRRFRFGGAQLKAAAIRAYCDGIDWDRSVLLAWLDRGRIRGVAQIAVATPSALAIPFVPAAPTGAAEFAVSVERAYQRRGIGERLLRQAATVARNRGIRDLYMLCLPENEPMKRLARRVGIALVFKDGEVVGRIGIDAPDQLTVMAEYAEDAAGWVDRWIDWFRPDAEPDGPGPTTA